MKRFVMFALAVMLVMVSSTGFAADFAGLAGQVNVSIQVPQYWEAQQDTYPTIGRTVACIKLTDQVNDNRWLWIFFDQKQDASGTLLSLNEVGNRYVQWHTDNNRRADRIDNEDIDGYFELRYYITALNTRKQVFIDNAYDARVTAGLYMCYLYPDTVTKAEALAIIDSMTINGQGKNPPQPDPGPTPDPSADPTPTPTPTPTTKSGGGGCSAMGTGLFAALMFAVSAMVYRRR